MACKEQDDLSLFKLLVRAFCLFGVLIETCFAFKKKQGNSHNHH